MRKILTSRLFRCLICLILVCSFLVLSSPIRAQAVLTEAATGFVVVGGIVVIAAVFQALGVLPGLEPIHFNDKVNECFEHIKNTTSYVVNGGFQVLGTMAALETGYLSFLPRDLIQNVLDWLYASGTLSSSVTASSQTFEWLGYAKTVTSSIPFELACLWRSGYYNYAGCMVVAYAAVSSADSFAVEFDGNTVYGNRYGNYYVAELASITGVTLAYEPTYTGLRVIENKAYHNYWKNVYNDIFGSYLSPVSTSFDLTLGQIHAPIVGTDEDEITIEIAPIYVDWSTGQKSFIPPGKNDDGSDRDPIPYWPVGIPSTDYSYILEQDQEQAQSGQTGIDFESAIKPDDGGTGDGSGTGTGSDPNPGGSGSSSWAPPSDHTQFQLVDLKNFFPFCIPFDLFKFFELLHAEPVAPVLYWEMADLAGETYSITIDLSEWNSVAQLFRRLQLFLFICGLAAASRKFIKW